MFIDHIKNITVDYPDQIDRRIFVVGIGLISESWELMPHTHQKGQLIFVEKGVTSLETTEGIWNVPFQGAVWIPPKIEHHSIISHNSTGLIVFIDQDNCAHLPKNCCTLNISSFLREVLKKVATFPEDYDESGYEGQLVEILLKELKSAPLGELNLPLPKDPRLKKLTVQIMKNPVKRETLKKWAEFINMSSRNMSRLFLEETGMSVNQWRRQLHVVNAIFMLGEGRSLQEISDQLGYKNISSFITMFRRITGIAPKKFITEHRAQEGQYFNIPARGFYEYK